MALTIDELNIEIEASASEATKNIEALANTLGRLATIAGKAKSLSSVAKAINNIAVSSASLNNVNYEQFGNNISRLANSLKPLNSIKGQIGATVKSLSQISTISGQLNEPGMMGNFSNGILGVKAALEPLKTVTSSIGNTLNSLNKLGSISLELENSLGSGNLAGNLNKLASALSGLSGIGKVSLRGIINQIKNLMEASASFNDVDSVAEKLTKLGTALSSFNSIGKSSLGTLINNLKKLPELSREMQTMDLDRFTEQIKRLSTALAPLAAECNKISAGFARLPQRTRQVINAFETVTGSTRKAEKSFKSLISGAAGAIGKFSVLFYAVNRLANVFSDWYDESNDYIENLNLFTVTMGEAADSAYKYAEKVQELAGIDISEWMSNQGKFQQLATGFGISAEKAAIMSKNLTQLGYDLASFFNVNVEESMAKLQSGMTGQIKGLKEYGINLSIAALQEYAIEQGITKKVRAMTEAEKSLLRYNLVMSKTVLIQGDMARTLITPANALRILNSQITQMKRALGNIVSVLIAQLIPYIQVFVQLITRAATAIASFFGFELPKIDYSAMGDLGGGFADNMDSAAGSVGSAGKGLKEMKKQLMGFDELNILDTSKMPSGGGGSIGGGGGIGGPDLGLGLAEYDFLKGLSSRTDEIMEKLKKGFMVISTLVTAIGAGIATWKLLNALTATKGIASTVSMIWSLAKALRSPSVFFTDLKTLYGAKAVIGGIAVTVAVLVGRFMQLVYTNEDFRQGLNEIFKGFKNMYNYAVNTLFPTIVNGFAEIIPPEAVECIKNFTAKFKDMTRFLSLDFGDLLLTLGGIGLLFTPAGPFGIAILGFQAVSLAIRGIGYGARDAIEPVDLFADGISELSKSKLEPFIKDIRALDDTIVNLDWTGKIIDQSVVTDIGKKVKAISDTIINELDADKNEALKTLEPLKKALGQEAYNKLLQDNSVYYEEMKGRVEEGEARINAIVAKASSEKRQLTANEKAEINRIQEEMLDTGVQHLTETEIEYQTIMNRMKDNSSRVSLEQASNIIKNAKKTRDEAISAAERQYSKVELEAQRMLEVGSINEDQYNQIIEAAKKTKDSTVSDADRQYSDIYNTVTTKLGDMARFIDANSGEIRTKWEVTWSGIKGWFENNMGRFFSRDYWRGKFTGMLDTARQKMNELKGIFENWRARIKLPHIAWDYDRGFRASGMVKKTLDFLGLPSHIPGLKVNWYAQGGFPDTGELFVAREAGPEMVGTINGKTSVANNDQIVQGISKGVYSAVTAAMRGNGNNNSTGDGDLVLMIDGSVVGKVALTQMRKMQRQGGISLMPV